MLADPLRGRRGHGTILAMNDPDSRQPAARERASRIDDIMSAPPVPRGSEWSARDTISLTVGAGLLAACVAALVGLVLVFGRTRAECGAGCSTHPQALEGVGVLAFAVMLAILVVLAGTIAKATLVPRSDR